jgi:hypothetical protein
LGAELGIDFDPGHATCFAYAVGHQPHHRAGPRADVEAVHAGPDAGAIEHLRRCAMP